MWHFDLIAYFDALKNKVEARAVILIYTTGAVIQI